MESSEVPSRVLVVAHKTAATQPLLDAVRERAQRGPARFTLLVPRATHGLHKVVDPEDQDAGETQAVIDHALPLLSEAAGRSEERRVGKEGRSRWSPGHEETKVREERTEGQQSRHRAMRR